MVHITHKQKPPTTGLLGMRDVNDCDGKISKTEWDDLVRRDAIEAREAEQRRLDEKRQKQLEQAATLQQQIDAKKNKEDQERRVTSLSETQRLQRESQVMSAQREHEDELKNTYRSYLQRCHDFSVANRSVSQRSGRKDILQDAGSNLMPFIKPSEEQRYSQEMSSQRELHERMQKWEAHERSISPMDTVSKRWRAEQVEASSEMEALRKIDQKRLDEKNRLRDIADRRAARALVAAQPFVNHPQPPSREIAAAPSPRHVTAPVQPVSRRDVQDAFREALEQQLEAKRRIQAEQLLQSQTKDKATMKQLGELLESTRKREQMVKESRQLAYRDALNKQLHVRDDAANSPRGFLPEVVVNPYRSHQRPQQSQSRSGRHDD